MDDDTQTPLKGLAPLSANMRLLLKGIDGPESGGHYGIRYGGQQGPQFFTDFSKHPNVAVQIPGSDKTSTAAGAHQILYSTWAPIAKMLNLPDFSKESQDQAASFLAQRAYKTQTGRDLEADLADPTKFGDIATALKPTWPTITPTNISTAFGTTPPATAPTAAPPAQVTPFYPMASSPNALSPEELAQRKMVSQLQTINQLSTMLKGNPAPAAQNMNAGFLQALAQAAQTSRGGGNKLLFDDIA